MNLSSPHILKSSTRHQATRLKPAATALLLLLTAFAANATPITVPNASFESPSSPVSTSTNPDIIPGWVFNVKDGSQFGTMAISSNFNSPGASSGNDCAFINNDAVDVTDTITSATSLATIAPLTTYTLNVAIGNKNGTGLYNDPGNVSFSLLANGAVIATQEVVSGTVANGTFEDFSLTYTSPSSGPVIGEKLTIQLATLPQNGSAYSAAFDNVTLDAVPIDPPAVVPEPSSWALLVSGLLALACLMRRQIA